MKYYVKFIRRFYLPLLSLAVISLFYFGIEGVGAEYSQNRPNNSASPTPTDLKIVAVKNNQNITASPSVSGAITPTPESSASWQINNIESSPTPQPIKVTTKINAGRRAGNYILDYQQGENAYMLLKKATNNDIQFTDWGGDLGIFVDCIGEICKTSGYEYFWSLYINGRLSEVGSSQYIVRPYDIIEWKYAEADYRY